MEKEKIDEVIKILQAFKEGKTIEFCGTYINWVKIDNLTELLEKLHSNKYQVRIRKEPTYRPYKNAEEFWKDYKEHGPTIIRSTTVIPSISNSFVTHSEYISIAFPIPEKEKVDWIKYKYSDLYGMSNYDNIKWQDGHPLAVLEEELEDQK